MKNISYPSAFGQTLGLLQTIIVEDDEFQRGYMTTKLKEIIDIVHTKKGKGKGKGKSTAKK